MAFLHTIPYGGGESTSIPPDSPHKSTSSTTATVPSPSIAKVRIIRRLHMYANRKSGISKLFEPPWPSYTPYHMVAESRPLYLLIRLINPPLRLQRRVPSPSIAKVRIIRRLHMYANRKSGMSKLFEPPWPSYTPYHIYGGGESTSIPPDSPHKSTSSTTATVPSPSIAKVLIIRRLHMYANRKSGMSKLFG